MKRTIRINFLILLLTLSLSAETLTGQVVKVADGDTITVLDSSNTQHRIRLISIDAPESNQAFGQKSKAHLSSLCFGKKVKVEWKQKDRYKRILGVVFVGKVNCNEEMLKAGFAWHYRQYSKDKKLQAMEDMAKAEKKGLWADKEPVPPWEFRRKK